jgi:cytoskeletal protein RodZ
LTACYDIVSSFLEAADMSESTDCIESLTNHTAPGKVLRAAREAAGLTQAVVSTKLNLSKQYIKDIEADDYSHFSAEIYVSGYLRSYASLLGLDAAPLLAAFREMGFLDQVKRIDKVAYGYLDTTVQRVELNHDKRRRWALWGSSLVGIFILMLLVSWWQGQRHQQHGGNALAVLPTNGASGEVSLPAQPLQAGHATRHHS